MASLERELAHARDLNVTELADAVQTIGFECTRCGACCTGAADDPHTATIYPDEVRRLRDRPDTDWRDVARPMPYGLQERDEPGRDPEDADDGSPGDDDSGLAGETLEWALQTDDCGDCTFYAEDGSNGQGSCTVHPNRPLVCRTYPFSVAMLGTSQPMGRPVDREGPVRAHECEGLGRDIGRAEALKLARALKDRAIRDVEEAIAVRDRYEPVRGDAEAVVVHDSEGAKRPDGTLIDRR